MLYIVSISYDRSTNDVIDWLSNYQISFFRHNLDIDNKPKSFTFIESVDSYWYRKGIIDPIINIKHQEIYDYLKENNVKIFEYQEYLLSSKKNLNSYSTSKLNKLIVLTLAKKIGLQIPNTKVMNSNEFLNFSDNLIYKPINEGGIIKLSSDTIINCLTQKYNYSNNLNFSHTLFQEEIVKKYELRIFYLNGKLWSMAIFSQNNSKTSVDFRNYDNKKPNRQVPYNLPQEIKEKLIILMNNLNLKSGSIDMIVSKNNDYVFLEVNPVGQFGMVSYPCNYNLEEQIAIYFNYE